MQELPQAFPLLHILQQLPAIAVPHSGKDVGVIASSARAPTNAFIIALSPKTGHNRAWAEGPIRRPMTLPSPGAIFSALGNLNSTMGIVQEIADLCRVETPYASFAKRGLSAISGPSFPRARPQKVLRQIT